MGFRVAMRIKGVEGAAAAVEPPRQREASAEPAQLHPPEPEHPKELTIELGDGVKMEFQNAPFTEAPSEMHTWFPEKKVFWTGENVTGTFHNIYTLRGAMVRDALAGVVDPSPLIDAGQESCRPRSNHEKLRI